MLRVSPILLVLVTIIAGLVTTARAETPEEWVALGTRVHGFFGGFIPAGIRVGLDAKERLKAEPGSWGQLAVLRGSQRRITSSAPFAGKSDAPCPTRPSLPNPDIRPRIPDILLPTSLIGPRGVSRDR